MIYTFLRQANTYELCDLFRKMDASHAADNLARGTEIQDEIDNFETHFVPIIADIDADFGNA
ncbi:hypothetical protein [Acidocella sp.]|uniref:hypothetical protein n=1 Tax=Acidocella sp. TaxID=50710 RepID=UPI00260D6E50|nr:hypothetical protein [Acidocella sp.]